MGLRTQLAPGAADRQDDEQRNRAAAIKVAINGALLNLTSTPLWSLCNRVLGRLENRVVLFLHMPPPLWERGWLVRWGMGSGLALGRAAECMAHGPHAWTTTICISPLANLSTFVRRVGGVIPRLAPTPLRGLGGAVGPFGGAGCAGAAAVCDSSAARAGYRAVGGQVRPTTAATIGKGRGGCQSVATRIYEGLERFGGGSHRHPPASPPIPAPHPSSAIPVKTGTQSGR